MASLISCGDQYAVERHHDTMHETWVYFMGYQYGLKGTNTGQHMIDLYETECREIPRLLHHYTSHHSDNKSCPSWIPVLDRVYQQYLERNNLTNQLFSLEVAQKAAIEEGY